MRSRSSPLPRPVAPVAPKLPPPRAEADRLVRQRALSLGFDLVGVARADEPIELDYERYEAFISAGRQGEMDYLADNRDARRRLDGDSISAGAKSVVCVADNYALAATSSDGEASTVAAIARYARGRDYHKHLRRRIRKLAAFMRRLGPDVEARPITDTAPVLERAWARRAGLGFVGKNGMLIAPGVGSFILVGEVVTTLDLVPDTAMNERCGSCTACLDACPTQAFAAPFVLDARRCISYLTIELRGPIPEELRAGVGEHLFGCDVCQEVCPFNRAVLANGRSASEHPMPRPDPGLIDGTPVPGTSRSRYEPLARWTTTPLESLVDIDDATWQALKECSPVARATQGGLERNAVTVLANRRNPRYKSLFEKLAAGHRDPAVREHALFGLGVLAQADPTGREDENGGRS